MRANVRRSVFHGSRAVLVGNQNVAELMHRWNSKFRNRIEKLWQNRGTYLGNLGAFLLSESHSNQLWNSLCARQGSNLQPCDPQSQKTTF